jgi:hypothetical protein
LKPWQARIWLLTAVTCLAIALAETSTEAAPTGREDGEFQVDPDALAAADLAINEPAGEADVPKFLEAVERHPYHREVMRRMQRYGEHTLDYTQRKYRRPDGSYEPERARLHQQIVQRLLNPRAHAAANQTLIALIIVGIPGAGKSTQAERWRKRRAIECTNVNPDDVQSGLPEYEGWNADLLHAEARDVAETLLLPRAIELRHHIMLDFTGRDPARVNRLADQLADRGYELDLICVDLPPGKAAYRAWQRFRKAAFVRGKTDSDAGRFIRPRLITSGFGDKPGKSYLLVKNCPAVRHWLRVSTDVLPDECPIALDQGER